MVLPAEIISLLKNEAYAVLCKEVLSEALAKVDQDKQHLISTRPPFGVLASSEAKQGFQNSMKAIEHNESALRSRVEQLNLLDQWFKAAIEKSLSAYLPTINPTFKICQQAASVVTRWEETVTQLQDQSLALARDARGVAAALNPIPLPNGRVQTPAALEGARLRALATLRIAVSVIQGGLAEIAEITKEFMDLCDAEADGLQLPLPPEFRDVAWVDRIATLNPAKATAEAVRCEAEARAFCNTGLKALLSQAAEVREACLDAGKTILNTQWRQLTEYAQARMVEERPIDEIIAELVQVRTTFESNKLKAGAAAANAVIWR